jgi:Rad3-related DNA helicase
MVDEAVCHLGVPCYLKGGGCHYFDAYRRAIVGSEVVTNYSYWLSVHEYAEGLGGFDFMVCDEAHNALDELGNHLSTHISDWEIDAFMHKTRPDDTPDGWDEWASKQLISLEPKLNVELMDLRRHPQNRSLLRRIHDLRRVVKKLHEVQDIATSPGQWVFEGDKALTWTPVWPGRGSVALFRGVRRVLLVSATLTRKSMDLLGLTGYEFLEYPSTFPIANRPVIHLATGVALRHDTDRAGLKAWADKIDQVIQFRLDRKGIIHTVSYARRDYLLTNSRYRGYMISHDRRNARAKVEEFKRSGVPAILVSPSMDTGYDFAGDHARWQIVAKVPFPDSRSPVLEARTKDDREYAMHVTMTTLVQAAGRIVRAEDDWGETFIIDDQASWFLRKYRKFAPRWFLDALRLDVMVTPPPLRAGIGR